MERPERIREIRVEQTWVGGVNIYRRNGSGVVK